MTKRILRVWFTALLLAMVAAGSGARAQHQTSTFSPVAIGSTLPYQIELVPTTFGEAELPTLHSFAAAEYDGKWVLLAGRTNGLHGFSNIGNQNFPEEFQNREVWVIDPQTGESWSKSLEDASSGLTQGVIDSITPTNNQFTQIGDRLYMTGGYGTRYTGGFTTFNTLTAIDLDGIVDWVVYGTGQAADHLRQTSDPLMKVTGGGMYEIDGQVHLVFGHDFNGGYTPGRNGEYTKQIRTFEIVDDGTSLSIANASSTTPLDEYRRRDLNVFPILKPDGLGGTQEALVALSGVFTESFGVFTVPVEVDALGQPTMADPLGAGTFKQAANNYHSAKLGLYSSNSGEMHELLLGGITLQYYDDTSQTFLQDDNMPWTNDLTAVRIDADGNYTQHYLGRFPYQTDIEGNELRFGANAEFFVADGIATHSNGVIDFDSLLPGDNMVGYVFGGIVANAPHVRDVEGAMSAASDQVFEVIVSLLHGDYNRDGKVDAADYTIWRNSLGSSVSPGLGADGDLSGTIDAGDYTIWKDNFGLTNGNLGPGSLVAEVPEPNTRLSMIALALAAIAGLQTRRRRSVHAAS